MREKKLLSKLLSLSLEIMKKVVLLFTLFFFFFFFSVVSNVYAKSFDDDIEVPLVKKKEERKQIVSTEYGDISAVDISDGSVSGSYHLQFITLEPNSLFLPVLLHSDMVFYVHTGSGRLSWSADDETRHVSLRRGDVYRLKPGTVFFAHSDLEPERQKLRIYAIFTNSAADYLDIPSAGAYSRLNDLVLGFDKKVLQAALKVPDEVIEELTSAEKPPPIVHGVSKKGRTFWEWETQFMNNILGSKGYDVFDVNKKKEKTKGFNILSADHDFENRNGWSLIVTKKDLNALKGSNIGLFMVNLTKGSMMGPHWNPRATEIAVVVQGQGMIWVVCSSTAKKSQCKNARFKVEEGDVFVVPRFHPMAQISFNNSSFVFMGFSTSTKNNHPQFLGGKSSALQTLDKQILAMAFNVPNATLDKLLVAQGESIILACTYCAEEEERIMEEEIEKERKEARKREEEEARKREEEKRREEEEARKREEEEAKKREAEKRRREEEEEARKREEEKRKEEEEAREREEEKRREEEEARKREEEEAREREEEKRRQEEEEEEEAREREDEEAREREEEEARRKEEGAREREEEKRREEEDEARRKEEEEARKREEKKARREEEAREREEEKKREEEEEARREEEAREREEEKRRVEEEEARREEEAREREEEKRRREEKEARRREEEEAREREEEEEAKTREEEAKETQREEEKARRQEEEEEEGGEEEKQQEEELKRRKEEAVREEEAARRQEEEMEKQHGGGGGGGDGEGEVRMFLKKMWQV